MDSKELEVVPCLHTTRQAVAGTSQRVLRDSLAEVGQVLGYVGPGGLYCDFTELEGAVAWVFVIANDKPQAGQIKRYFSGIFHASKGLRQLVENETREQIKLKTSINISVKTSSFRTLRG